MLKCVAHNSVGSHNESVCGCGLNFQERPNCTNARVRGGVNEMNDPGGDGLYICFTRRKENHKNIRIQAREIL